MTTKDLPDQDNLGPQDGDFVRYLSRIRQQQKNELKGLDIHTPNDESGMIVVSNREQTSQSLPLSIEKYLASEPNKAPKNTAGQLSDTEQAPLTLLTLSDRALIQEIKEYGIDLYKSDLPLGISEDERAFLKGLAKDLRSKQIVRTGPTASFTDEDKKLLAELSALGINPLEGYEVLSLDDEDRKWLKIQKNFILVRNPNLNPHKSKNLLRANARLKMRTLEHSKSCPSCLCLRELVLSHTRLLTMSTNS